MPKSSNIFSIWIPTLRAPGSLGDCCLSALCPVPSTTEAGSLETTFPKLCSALLLLHLSERSTNLRQREAFCLMTVAGSFWQLLRWKQGGGYFSSQGSDHFFNGSSLVVKTSPADSEVTVQQQVLSQDHGLRSAQGYFQLLICEYHPLFLVALQTPLFILLLSQYILFYFF